MILSLIVIVLLILYCKYIHKEEDEEVHWASAVVMGILIFVAIRIHFL